MMFNERMRELRRGLGISQAALVERLPDVRGVTETTISRLEMGTWIPDAGQMAHILDALQVPPEQREEVYELARDRALRSPRGIDTVDPNNAGAEAAEPEQVA